MRHHPTSIRKAVHRSLIRNKERLIFALDVPSLGEAQRLVETLGDTVHFYKLGLQLFMTGEYFSLVEWLAKRGCKIFADLKLFDVPETVKLAVRELAKRPITFTTVHGNDSMMRAAAEAKGETLKILAVTFLTSLDQGDLRDLGFRCDVAELVLSRARRALESGCDGVISSGLEVATIRESLGPQIIVVSPGIRPVENRPADDQKRVVSVPEAFRNGADYIVVGRPIRDAKDPAAAAAAVQEQISECFSK